jgi:hypothetical protein
VRLATWNVNSVKARLPRLLDWLAETKPDIVCLQEIKCAAALFPSAEVGELGYQTAAHGDGRWNGVALLSAVGLDDVSLGFPCEPGYQGEPGEPALIDEPGLRRPEARAVGATCGGIRVLSLYAGYQTHRRRSPGVDGSAETDDRPRTREHSGGLSFIPLRPFWYAQTQRGSSRCSCVLRRSTPDRSAVSSCTLANGTPRLTRERLALRR